MMVQPAQADGDASGRGELALVLDGGGARAAYQVGLLRCLVKNCPDLDLQRVNRRRSYMTESFKIRLRREESNHFPAYR